MEGSWPVVQREWEHGLVKIRFRYSGDFTGLIREAAIDLDQLPQATAEHFSEIALFIQKSGNASAPAGAARDAGQYEIDVVDGKRSMSVGYPPMSIPEQVVPLIQYMKRIAKPIKL